MVFVPTAKGILAEAVPDITAVPLTVTVEVGTLVVGVTVTDATALLTDVVNVVILPDVPVLVSVEAGVNAMMLNEVLEDRGKHLRPPPGRHRQPTRLKIAVLPLALRDTENPCCSSCRCACTYQL